MKICFDRKDMYVLQFQVDYMYVVYMSNTGVDVSQTVVAANITYQ